MRGHYEGIDKKIMHAMKVRKLASDVSLIIHWIINISVRFLVLYLEYIFFERLLMAEGLTFDLTFQIAYKKGCEQEPGEYNYPATQTPGYRSQRKLDPLKDVSSLTSKT